MSSVRLTVALLLLISTFQLVLGDSTPFVGCLNGNYRGGTWQTMTLTSGQTCASACTQAGFRYAYYKATSTTSKTCACGPEAGPPYTAFVTSQNGAGDCAGEQWHTTMSDSSYTFQGCPTTITPNTSPALVQQSGANSHYQCLKACFSYQQAFVNVGDNGVWGCYCSPANGGATASGFTQCKVYNSASPRYYAYTHEPGAAANQASGFYRKRRMERLEKKRQSEMALYAFCPKPLRACKMAQDMEAFECIDVENELESCGGCVDGDFNLDPINPINRRGVDCTSIPGSTLGGTTCTRGRCVVSRCQKGWRVNPSRNGCERMTYHHRA